VYAEQQHQTDFHTLTVRVRTSLHQTMIAFARQAIERFADAVRGKAGNPFT